MTQAVYESCSGFNDHTVASVVTQVLYCEAEGLRCCCYQHMLGSQVHIWSGFQRLYSCTLLAPAAANSATSCEQTVQNKWLHRLPAQLTLRAAVSCVPAF